MSTTANTGTKTTNSARQLGELGNQAYLSLVDGFLRGGERNIRVAQTVLAQADVLQRRLRIAVESAGEQSKTIQDASRALATEFYDSSARMLNASQTIVEAFNTVLFDAVQAGAEIGQAALRETRAAGAETFTKMDETGARARVAADAVRDAAEAHPGNGARKP